MLQISHPGYTCYCHFRHRKGNTKSTGFSLLPARAVARVLIYTTHVTPLISFDTPTHINLYGRLKTVITAAGIPYEPPQIPHKYYRLRSKTATKIASWRISIVGVFQNFYPSHKCFPHRTSQTSLSPAAKDRNEQHWLFHFHSVKCFMKSHSLYCSAHLTALLRHPQHFIGPPLLLNVTHLFTLHDRPLLFD